MGDDSPIRYEDAEGRIIYRASGLMMCDRIFAALVNNYGPQAHPAWFQEVLDEGTAMESEIVSMYELKYDIPVLSAQQEILMEILDGVFIKGHIDGLAGPALFEAKKFRESTWMKFMRQGVECLPWYPWQVSTYMHALELEECVVVGGLFKDGGIVNIEVKQLSMPPIPLKAIQKRVAKLEHMVNSGKGVDEVPCADPRQYPCPFHYLHDADDQREPPQRLPDDEALPMLAELAEIKVKLTPLNKQLKELDERKKEINNYLFAFLELNGVDDDVECLVGDQIVKFHRTFNPGSGPYDYVRVTTKQAPKLKRVK